MLNAPTGAITGTPTATANNLALTFQVKDSGNPAQSKTADLTLTIAPAPGISVSIAPRRGGVALNQLLVLTATVVNDVATAGVTWSVSAGGVLSGHRLQRLHSVREQPESIRSPPPATQTHQNSLPSQLA